MKKPNQHSNSWNEKELNILKDESLSNREVAEILDFTYSAVKQKRRSLGIDAKKDINTWSGDEIKTLIKNKNLNNVKLSKLIDRSPAAISLKRTQLGIPFEENIWEEDEIEYLITNYDRLSQKEIAEFLGRTISAVSSYAYELGITRRNDFWKKEELQLLSENFDKPLSELSKLITTKNKNQIVYKRHHIKFKSNRNVRDEENIESGIAFSRGTKITRYIEVLNALKIEESFEFPKKEYTYFLEARNLIPDKFFKTKKSSDETRRAWRLF